MIKVLRYLLLFLIISCLINFTVFAAELAQQPGPTGAHKLNSAPSLKIVPTVTGLVYDYHGGRIPGATVKLGDLVTTTNSTGNFVFSGVKQGIYTIVVEKSGYSTVTLYNRTISPEESYNRNLEIALVGRYTLSIAVKDQSGAYVSPATVTVQTPGYPHTALSFNGSGSTHQVINMAGPKEITVVGLDTLYLPQTRQITVDGHMLQTFVLIPRLYTVQGVVTNSSGSPLPGIPIMQDGRKTNTDKQGRYVLSAPAGTSRRIIYNPADHPAHNANYQTAEVILNLTQNTAKNITLAAR